jgi:hypothetical protein
VRVYTVHAPPDEPAEPERFVFVKDGFSWPALLVAVLFILWHRLWLTLVGYVIFVLLVGWVGRLVSEDAAMTFAVLGSLLFALEANAIRRLSLESRGWREVGAAYGRDRAEAEFRFFDRWSGSGTASVDKAEAMARAAYSPTARERGADEPILGLFPEPER